MPLKNLLKGLTGHHDKHHEKHHDQDLGNGVKETVVTTTEVHRSVKEIPLYKQHMEQVIIAPINTTDEEAAVEMQRLNNILADYKRQMQDLENTNCMLTAEFNRLRQPLVTGEIHQMKITDSTAPLPATANKLQGPYAAAVANTEDLRIRLARSERERHEQVRRAQVLQQKMMQKEAEKEDLHKETDKAENERKAVEHELEAVQEKLRRETAATEMERLARRYAQLKVQQLRALETNYINSMKGLRNEVKEVTEVSASTVAEADLQQNVEQIRQDYANTSAKLSNDFEKRARKFEQMWTSESRAVDELKRELEDLKQKIAPLGCLQNQNSELRAKLDALKRDLIAAEQNRDMLYKKFEAANRHSQELKKIIEGEHAQMGGSAKLYGAVADYRDIVEGELVPNQQGIQPKGVVHTTKVVEEKTVRKETGLGHQ